jgi:hypothetical protein
MDPESRGERESVERYKRRVESRRRAEQRIRRNIARGA